jgi:hypothetical protein
MSSNAEASTNLRRNLQWSAIAFGFALLVRLLFLLSSPDRSWPHSAYYEGDAPQYWVRWATALEEDKPFEFDLPLRSPAVAYLMHWIPGGHDNFLTMKILWCVISAMTCGLAYLSFARIFSHRVALIASTLCIFSFGLNVTATSLNNETLYTFMLTAIMLGHFEMLRQPRWWIALAVGGAHGIATLIRPEHSLLLVLISLATLVLWPRESRPKFMARVAIIGMMMLSSIVICLPWSISGSIATHRFNTIAENLPDYDQSPIRWTPEARQFLDSLPAFTRDGTFKFMNALAQASQARQIDRDDLQRLFDQRFGYTPEPLSEFAFISLKGPFDFVLANHRNSTGGFTRSVLQNPNDPPDAMQNVAFGRPDHLRLFNHGYSIGWNMIRSDFNGWLQLVARKLSIFAEGLTLGFTAHNPPYGREGVRRPIDLMTPFPDASKSFAGGTFRMLFIALLCIGALSTFALPKQQRSFAAFWLLIIIYKLLIVIAFYGYARQAVSIAPALYLFIALGINWFLQFLPESLVKLLPPIGFAIVAALLMTDVHAAWTNTLPEIRPVQTDTPQWGERTFQSFELIEIHRKR